MPAEEGVGHLIIKKGHVGERATKSLIKCFCVNDSILTLLGLSLMLLTFMQKSKYTYIMISTHLIIIVLQSLSNEDD